MKLPNNKNAIISKQKLTDYILSTTHLVGKFKARYFQKFGFNETNVKLLEKQLRKISKSQEVTNTIVSIFGTKYIIDAEIETPKGRRIKIRSIWIIEAEQNKPRFLTVYPV